MADPLLTTLCTICHAQAPKYVCPGCSQATCSLACSQKHKAWANCSGRRDPTAYMPASKLKTPAGVDHDYNFLTAIERERDRNQRELVEDRRLFTEQQLREAEEPRRWRRQWFGEEVRFVSNERGAGRADPREVGSDGEGEGEGDSGGEGNGHAGGGRFAGGRKASSLVRKVRGRLEKAGTEVMHMPAGMSRQRENTTAWNRKAARINWCVEWIVYDTPGGAPTRIRHKALETTPLYRALGNSLAWHQHGQKKEEDSDSDEEEMLSAYARKRRRVLIKEVKDATRRSAMQDADSETWLATPYPTQNPYNATWDTDRTASAASWLPDQAVEAKREHRFFLHKALTPAGKPRELIPLSSGETLGHALEGRTVLEFPTVYVLPPSASGAADAPELPDGCLLGSTERKQRQRKPKPKPEKRKVAFRDARSEDPQKRQALDEDGAVVRGGRNQRGRGGRGGARGRGGRGGRFQQRQQTHKNPDAEEGEINSDGDEVLGAKTVRADTSSSDPDTSDNEGHVLDDDAKENIMYIGGGGGGAAPEEPKTTIDKSTTAPAAKTTKMGLVDYGSDSDVDGQSGSGEDDEDEGVDMAALNPENPELVVAAVQEIVGLLT